MSSSSSKSVQAGASDYHHPDPMETTTVVEDQASETEGVNVYVRKRFKPKRRWTALEDAKLVMHFAVHGARKWSKISEKLPGRTKDACRVRWGNYLSPGNKDSVFSKEEELYLMLGHARSINKRTGRNDDSVDSHFHALMAKKRRGMNLIPSATMAAGSPATAIFTDSAVVYPAARSSSRSRTTAAGSGRDLLRNYSTYKCVACRFNLNADVHGQRTSMVDCGICMRVAEIGRMNGETYMASTGNVHRSPSAFPSVNMNINLASTVHGPQPPSSPPTSPSSPLPPTFIDFLGIESD